MTPMSLERRQVIRVLQSMGWTAVKQPKNLWKFSRPDIGGLWDTFTINQASLSWPWLMLYMLRHPEDGDFALIVADLWNTYRKHQFAKTLKEITE